MTLLYYNISSLCADLFGHPELERGHATLLELVPGRELLESVLLQHLQSLSRGGDGQQEHCTVILLAMAHLENMRPGKLNLIGDIYRQLMETSLQGKFWFIISPHNR